MKKIGKYDVVREIGHGATATVYLGNDPFIQREVAIKVAFPEILKHKERGKLYTHLFLNEASLVGNPIADPELPLEVLRTIHSFDPCLACAIHLVDGKKTPLSKVKVL